MAHRTEGSTDDRARALAGTLRDGAAAEGAGRARAPRRRGRSTGAVLAGLAAILALSLGTDHLLHVLDVYPPWGQPMPDIGDNLLALGYRIVYGILGSYLTARLAPRAPMGHALTLGAIGVLLSLLGAIAAITADMGPAWYPVALVVTALPCGWVGGALHRP